MATRRVNGNGSSDSSRKKQRPATSPEARENQLVSLAYDLAERQLLDGTASSQVITQFLKLGSTREKVELEKLRNESQLITGKIESMASAQRVEALYGEALAAMRAYSGQQPLQMSTEDDGEGY